MEDHVYKQATIAREESTMFRHDEIHSLTDFQRKTREHLARLKETRRPEVLTVHGEAEVVVQDAAAYQSLLDRLERAEAIAGISDGLASRERDDGQPLEEAVEAIRAKHRDGRPT